MHSQSLIRGIEAGAFRDGPTQQRTVKFEPQIIMEPGRVVFLDQIRVTGRPVFFAGRRLGGFRKISFSFVFFERHWLTTNFKLERFPLYGHDSLQQAPK